jgi:uroporphyrin-III C-methyltransferase
MPNFDLNSISPPFEPGTVWLVGAGPGDPGLLTLYALAAIQQADVLIYDALVGKEIIALVDDPSKLIYAGKRGGKPSAKQPDITQRIIDEAKAGKRVLRLKGGDPYIFGRGGEEALALVKSNIRFRVVPGITASTAGAANAGIPMTHRTENSTVTFVTGHSAFGEVPENINWDALSKGSPVLVLYMAIKHLDLIADRLIAAGRPASEPVAIVANASLPNEQVLITTLKNAMPAVKEAGLKPPAIVIVGPVVDLAKTISPHTL